MTLPTPESTVVQHTLDPVARRTNPLYLPARRIEPEEFAALPALLQQMRNVMQGHGGIGIAANQVGLLLQVFLMEAKADNPRYRVLGEVPYQVFVNPRIVGVSREKRNFWHGCLSAQGEARGNLATYEWVDFEAGDAESAVRRGRLEGLASVIFQHELRHLLGGTYLDRASTLLSKEELDRRLELKELPFFEPTGDELPLLIGDYRIGETLEEYYARA